MRASLSFRQLSLKLANQLEVVYPLSVNKSSTIRTVYKRNVTQTLREYYYYETLLVN